MKWVYASFPCDDVKLLCCWPLMTDRSCCQGGAAGSASAMAAASAAHSLTRLSNQYLPLSNVTRSATLTHAPQLLIQKMTAMMSTTTTPAGAVSSYLRATIGRGPSLTTLAMGFPRSVFIPSVPSGVKTGWSHCQPCCMPALQLQMINLSWVIVIDLLLAAALIRRSGQASYFMTGF